MPVVTGDGQKSIRQLLLDFNYDYFVNKLKDSKYDEVLPKNKTFEYSWKFNLSQGSIAKKVKDKILQDRLIKIAKQVCNEINLKFGSVDIIETTDNELLVLEVNSGVMLENYVRLNPQEYTIVKNIYRNAIKSLFKD